MKRLAGFTVMALCLAGASTARAADHVGKLKTHVTVYEDTLVKLARDNDVGFVELRAANPDVDPWLPGAGVEMVIPTMHILPDAPRAGVVINLPEMRLYRFDKKGKVAASYPIGIGREGLQTPVGQTTVRSKVVGPVWRPTPRMRAEDPKLPVEVGPGPDNPLGTHALYLGWAEYRIHGTNKPYGIGRRSSSGCIRMYPEDIISLYPTVPVGEIVTVVNQAVKAAWIGNELYVQAHPSMEQANRMEEDGGMLAYEMTNDDMARIMRAAGPTGADLDWKKIRKVIRERRGYPVVIATRPAPVATPVVPETGAEEDEAAAAAAGEAPAPAKESAPEPDKAAQDQKEVPPAAGKKPG